MAYHGFPLGRVPSTPDPRTLRLANYLDVALLPAAPDPVRYDATVRDWGMMLNDRLGDCTVAAVGHAIQTWTANESGSTATVPDSEILKAYSAVGGYVPGRPGTDRGANMLDVLKYWRGTGVGGHKGIGFVGVDPTNLDQVKAALWLFGGLYGGCQIPGSWQSGDWGRFLDGYIGGHAWWLVGYSGSDYYVVTWGGVRRFTAEGWRRTMGSQQDAELYAVLGPEWTAKDGQSPSGFDAHALANDLAAIGGQPLPYPDPVPPPPPPPPPASWSPPAVVSVAGPDGRVYTAQPTWSAVAPKPTLADVPLDRQA